MNPEFKILIITESIDVNDSSGSKGRVAFIESFKRAGYAVTVLHYTKKACLLPGVECVAIHEKKFTVNYLLSRVQRLLYRYFKVDISKYVDTFFGFSFGFFNDVNSISEVLKKQDPEAYTMLWTFGKGTSFRTHAATLKNPVWHAKWYAFVHDPYPQHLYPRPYNFVEYGFKKKRRFFREVTLKAHKMVFPSLMLKEWMQSYFSHVENKSLILPHPLVHINPKTPLPAYFDSKKFNILHAGNLLNLRNPKTLVNAYEQFLIKVPEAKIDSALFFIGKDSIFQEFLFQKQLHIPQLYISNGYVPFEEVYVMQQNASVNVILEATSEISPFLPGKFPHCVAANKPILVIGPYYSECKRLLGKAYPYSFDFKDVDGITDSLKNLYYTWKEEKKNLLLDRSDLNFYLSSDYLRKVLDENP